MTSNITAPDFVTLSPRTTPMITDAGIIPKHKTPVLLKVHGIIMVFTWVVFATTGMLIARYYKNAWPERSLWGKPVWLQLHRWIFILVLILTLTGVAVAYSYEGPFYDIDEVYSVMANVHPPCGVTTLAITIVNPIIAFFRPDPQSPRRIYFYCVHTFLGFSAWILANVNICVAFGHPTGVNPVSYQVMNCLLKAWWGFVGISLLILEWHRCLIRKQDEGLKMPLNKAIWVAEHENFKSTVVNNRGATFLKSYLCVFVGITIVCAFAFILCLWYHGI